MFVNTVSKVRKSVYLIVGMSQSAPQQFPTSVGTAFAVAKGRLVTAAHNAHQGPGTDGPIHSIFYVINALDAWMTSEPARFVAEDTKRDIASFQIDKPRHEEYVEMVPHILPAGTPCGSIGFPLAKVTSTTTVEMIERFQGGYISAFSSIRNLSYYETDYSMLPSSSGCPVFLANGRVFGMHTKSGWDSDTEKGTHLPIGLWVPSTEILDWKP